MTTQVTIDSDNYSKISGQTNEFAIVNEYLFGGIMVNIKPGCEIGFYDSVDHMGLNVIRWPGGSLSEEGSIVDSGLASAYVEVGGADQMAWIDWILSDRTSDYGNDPSVATYAYDLGYPQVMYNLDLDDGTTRASLSEMITLANETGAVFEMIIPVERYTDYQGLIASGIASGDLPENTAGLLLDQLQTDVTTTLNNILVDQIYGPPPSTIIFDLGNENLAWAVLDPSKTYAPGVDWDPAYVAKDIGLYFDAIKECLEAVLEFRTENPGVDFKVSIMMPWMADKDGTTDPYSVFLSELNNLPPELAAQIDVVQVHSLDQDLQTGAELENWFTDDIQGVTSAIELAQAEVGRPQDVEIAVSAWSSNGERPGTEDQPQNSLQAAAASVAHVASMAELGADYAAEWGVSLGYSQEVQASYYSNSLNRTIYTPLGEVQRQMSETLAGTYVVSTKYTDLDATGAVNMQVFADDSKLVIFVSANDIASKGETVTLDLADFGTIGYAWAESIVMNATSASDTEKGNDGEAAIWNPSTGTTPANTAGAVPDFVYSGTKVTFTLTSDYQMVRIVVADTTPGAGDLYLMGNSQETSGKKNDLLLGGLGEDTLVGLSGYDTLDGGDAGKDILDGGDGNDMILAFKSDTVMGGDGSDTLVFDTLTDKVVASLLDGSNSLKMTISGIENLSGGGGSDGLTGSNGANQLKGGAGMDSLQGLGGNDSLYGEAGDDTLIGGGGNDELNGGEGRDKLQGGKGNAVLNGGEGHDTLVGGTGNDSFVFDWPDHGSDTILQFTKTLDGQDKVLFDASHFGGGLQTGTLHADQFVVRASDTQASDANDRFIFRTSDQSLWFDVDGKGGVAPILMCAFRDPVTLVASDIVLF